MARREARHEIYGAAIVFLSEEGYLRYTGQGGNQVFANVVLTTRGLAALQKTPEALQAPPAKSLGDMLIEASADLLKESAKEAIRQAMRMVLG